MDDESEDRSDTGVTETKTVRKEIVRMCVCMREREREREKKRWEKRVGGWRRGRQLVLNK